MKLCAKHVEMKRVRLIIINPLQ